MTLQAVFFDIGGTIETYWFDREHRVKNIVLIRECLHKVKIELDSTDECLADTITREMSTYHHWNFNSRIEIPPAEIWSKYIFKDYSIERGAIEPVAEELSFLYETRLYTRQMRPEIPEVLRKIQEMSLKIGCISNTQSVTQVPASLKKYGISSYFDPIVLSSVYGRRKPDSSIFFHAARLARVPTGACAYVGDKISRDVIGARGAGFGLSILIHHTFNDGEKEVGAVPDATIENMLELLPILAERLAKDQQHYLLSPGKKVKGIFFDAGDILYHRPQQGLHFKRFLKGKKLTPHAKIDSEKRKLKDLAFQGRLDRGEYYEKVVKLYGINNAQEIAAGIEALDCDDNTVEIMEGVPETIKALKDQGYILGIITDTALPIYVKLHWFEQSGFGHVWDSIVSSKEIGSRKPAAIIYQEALSQTGLKPDEAVFVGHKTSELIGARAVGMTTIAFNYDKNAPADIHIEQFSDLLNIPL